MRLSVEEGLALITPPGHSQRLRVEIHGAMCTVKSLRLSTFKTKGIRCVNCGKAGMFFAMERNPTLIINRDAFNSETYHMNLYGYKEDGTELLFTHDHILARGLGGKNELVNAQPMCEDCNQEKSIEEHRICNLVRAKGIMPTDFQRKVKENVARFQTESKRNPEAQKADSASVSFHTGDAGRQAGAASQEVFVPLS